MSTSISIRSSYPSLSYGQIFWSLTGTLVAIASEESFYILRFDRDAYTAKVEEGADLGDEGVEEAFEMVTEVHEKYLRCLISCTNTFLFLPG
jgi:hypothetical protein